MSTHALVQLPGYWADKLCSAFLGEISCPWDCGSGAEVLAAPVYVSGFKGLQYGLKTQNRSPKARRERKGKEGCWGTH